MKPTSEMNGKELTAEAQGLARLAGHVRLRGEGHPLGATETKTLREVVDEARAFEEKTRALREACAASLAKLKGARLDPATAALLDLSAEEQKKTPDSEASLFTIVVRARAWPPASRPNLAKLNTSLVAELLSVKVRKKDPITGKVGEPTCAFGVSRQSVHRAFKVAKLHGVSVTR